MRAQMQPPTQDAAPQRSSPADRAAAHESDAPHESTSPNSAATKRRAASATTSQWRTRMSARRPSRASGGRRRRSGAASGRGPGRRAWAAAPPPCRACGRRDPSVSGRRGRSSGRSVRAPTRGRVSGGSALRGSAASPGPGGHGSKFGYSKRAVKHEVWLIQTTAAAAAVWTRLEAHRRFRLRPPSRRHQSLHQSSTRQYRGSPILADDRQH